MQSGLKIESPREKIIALILEQDLLLSTIRCPFPLCSGYCGMPAAELLPRLVTASSTVAFFEYDRKVVRCE